MQQRITLAQLESFLMKAADILRGSMARVSIIGGLVTMMTGSIQGTIDAHTKKSRLKAGLMRELLSGRVSVAGLAHHER